MPLARRGYRAAGVDLSPEMLRVAREKVEAAGLDVDLVQGDVRNVRLDRRFSAVLLMFAVLGYQRTNEDVLATLRTAREHLEKGGLVVFDVWYGPGVLRDPPGRRNRTIETADGALEREVTADLDIPRQLCTVTYDLVRDGHREQETHVMRFFFPAELSLFCEVSSLELVSLTPFGSLDGEATEVTWNATAVAQAANVPFENLGQLGHP